MYKYEKECRYYWANNKRADFFPFIITFDNLETKYEPVLRRYGFFPIVSNVFWGYNNDLDHLSDYRFWKVPFYNEDIKLLVRVEILNYGRRPYKLKIQGKFYSSTIDEEKQIVLSCLESAKFHRSGNLSYIPNKDIDYEREWGKGSRIRDFLDGLAIRLKKLRNFIIKNVCMWGFLTFIVAILTFISIWIIK